MDTAIFLTCLFILLCLAGIAYVYLLKLSDYIFDTLKEREKQRELKK